MPTPVRANGDRSSSGVARSISFTESDPLPRGYTIVVAGTCTSSTSIPMPDGDGWFLLASGLNGTTQARGWAKLSDGFTNGAAWASGFPNVDNTLNIAAFAGEADLANAGGGGSNISSGTSRVFASTAIGGPAGVVIRIGALATAPTGWTGWSGSTMLLAPPSSARMAVSWADYPAAGSSTATTLTWVGSRAGYGLEFILPGLVVAPAAPGGFTATGNALEVDISFSAASGAVAYDIEWQRTDITPPSVQTQASAPYSLVQVDPDASGSTVSWRNDGTGTIGYIIDMGMRRTHVEFAGRTVTGANRPGNSGTWDTDTVGHGTEIASAMAGNTRGIARGADIHMVRMQTSPTPMPPTLASFVWAVDEVLAHNAASGKDGVVVYSGPLPDDPAEGGAGGSDFTAAIAKVVELLDAGLVVVMAEGNSAELESPIPTISGRVLMVGGTTSARRFWNDGVGDGSNYSPGTNILAPAKDVPLAFITSDSAYGTDTGTSFAAPFVAGVALRFRQDNPGMPPQRVVDAITSQAFAIPPGQPTGYQIPLLNADTLSTAYSRTRITSTTLSLPLAPGTYNVRVAAVGSVGARSAPTSAESVTVSDSSSLMPFTVGSEPVVAVFVGAEPVTAVYRGAELLWSA